MKCMIEALVCFINYNEMTTCIRSLIDVLVNRGSYINAHVLLNLLNKLKNDQMRGL